jgi:O-antigen/teichoic acid export membrane protein
MRINKIINISRDFSLNLISSLIITVITSFVINPHLAKTYTAEEFGLILTLASIVTIFRTAIGNTLNNVRLINTKSEDTFRKYNYNFIISTLSVLSSFVILGLSIFIYKVSFIISILLSIHTILSILTAYFVVTYRIKLDYKKNLIFSIIVAVFYFLGLILIQYVKFWPLIYIIGNFAGFVYILKTSDLVNESFKIDDRFRTIFKGYIILIVISIITNSLTFLDKIIILPLLGGEFVSYYSTAAFFGKSLGVFMAPIASVLLSYYSTSKNRLTVKNYWLINFVNIFMASIFFIISFFVAPFITEFLYPTLYNNAKEYLVIANLASIISVLAIMANPALLKYCRLYWQLVITITYGLMYIISSYFLISSHGLWGFAIATIVSNIYRLIFIYIIGHIGITKGGEKNAT